MKNKYLIEFLRCELNKQFGEIVAREVEIRLDEIYISKSLKRSLNAINTAIREGADPLKIDFNEKDDKEMLNWVDAIWILAREIQRKYKENCNHSVIIKSVDHEHAVVNLNGEDFIGKKNWLDQLVIGLFSSKTKEERNNEVFYFVQKCDKFLKDAAKKDDNRKRNKKTSTKGKR